MPGERRYWAFLSYAHADAKAADKLHRELEGFRVPAQLVGRPHPLGTIPKRLSPVFRDRQELAAASNLGREIAEAMEASNYLIVLCSPAAARSKWVDQEIREFRRLYGAERILAAILDGDPACDDAQIACFPPALREDLSLEPIAADLRVSGDGWRGGFLKIVAGMLDVGLDDLVQRDQQRRHKRMAWISVASLVGMTATSGLAVFALDQRDAAREERRQAEGLVEFMLGDLKGKLEPIGKLDALDGVGSKILDYYSRQDAVALDDAGLLQRSRALSLTAQVAYARGDLKDAEQLYRQAMAGTGEAARRSPGNAQYLFDHAQNVFWIGEIARYSGRMGLAEKSFREYQRLADAMVAIDPANPKWRMETVYAAENVAITLLNRRQFAEAARGIAAALGTMRAVALANPSNEEYQRELSTVMAWMADTRRDEGRLAEAASLRSRQIDFLTDRIASDEGNVRLREHRVFARTALGRLLDLLGRDREAIEQLGLAHREAQRLVAVEPDNAVWRTAAAGAQLDLASVLIEKGRVREAAVETAAGCGLTDSLRNRAPDHSSWGELQTACRMNRAQLALADGSPSEALVHAEQALESARREQNVDSFRPRYKVAAAWRLIGDARRALGNQQAARKAWAEGLAQLPNGIAERPREIADRLSLLDRLGHSDQARPLAERLRSAGLQRSM